MAEEYAQPAGVLYLAATPIGDVGDASSRFVTVFRQADIVAAEDTRRAKALAARLEITLQGKVIALHDHNEGDKADALLDRVEEGQRVVLVSDAGMPTVSDPGYRLVKRAVERGIPVSALPGPSAPVTALAVSGLPSDRFAFEGFLPRKEGEALRYLEGIAAMPHTLIFFESPKRLHETLSRMVSVLGGARQAVVCRELTKTYEDIWRGTLSDLLERSSGEVLGEITIVVEGARSGGDAADYVEAVLALANEGARLKDAAGQVAQATGLRKNELFKAALERLGPQK
ncbi:16S rRNA (cytidine(1402)-2'-O)-methyltransferase [Schaalia sp. Marseille-Q2122]|uniref:16S rRNA (cytidine(1402)-2'-O)-methyltransferase n=1 Tax=Schaalia sp. Marseille-Q2122 TaxID=2736604 RepID=UPI00158D7F3D|nr:16S rRNA (cytidine(1402)-2'-O)-methyltransferase [Schaalia sp. Marseille-Q2122]